MTVVLTPDGAIEFDPLRYDINVIDGGHNLIVTDRVDRATIAAFRGDSQGPGWLQLGGHNPEQPCVLMPCPEPECDNQVCLSHRDH